MRLSISEAAKLSGVSVRTLHYYDETGLLPPSFVAESGYRYYNEGSLEQLQQILFYRELDFSLKEIKTILSHPEYDQQQALAKQKDLLELKKERLNQLIKLIDKQLKGEKRMSFQEFDMKDINMAKEKYATEVEQKWGNTAAYKESRWKTDKYTAADWQKAQAEVSAIFAEFAALRETAPDSPQAFATVQKWQEYISSYHYPCTDEILAGLGIMYQEDSRFAETIDQAGEGTSAFMSKAIAAFCAK